MPQSSYNNNKQKYVASLFPYFLYDGAIVIYEPSYIEMSF